LARVGDDHLVSQLLELTADPSRLRPDFQCNAPRLSSKMLVNGGGLITESSFFNHLTLLVDDSLVAYIVAEIDANDLTLFLFFPAVILLHSWFSLHFQCVHSLTPPWRAVSSHLSVRKIKEVLRLKFEVGLGYGRSPGVARLA